MSTGTTATSVNPLEARLVHALEQIMGQAPDSPIHRALVANAYVAGSSTPIPHTDASGDTCQQRPLDDGSKDVVLKNCLGRDETVAARFFFRLAGHSLRSAGSFPRAYGAKRRLQFAATASLRWAAKNRSTRVQASFSTWARVK